MIALAAAAAYLIGSIPTADWLARLAGHDLRSSGTGNPGTANAMGLAGPRVALTILAIDTTKGALAVLLGRVLAGDTAGMAAVFAVIAGQILNPWFRFRGGKGLGVAFGAFIVAFPPPVGPLVPLIGAAVKLLGSAARGALVALAGLLVAGVLWGSFGWSTWWGVEAGAGLAVMVAAVVVLIVPKFALDVRREMAAARAPAA